MRSGSIDPGQEALGRADPLVQAGPQALAVDALARGCGRAWCDVPVVPVMGRVAGHTTAAPPAAGEVRAVLPGVSVRRREWPYDRLADDDRDDRPSLRCDALQAMLIYSMSVSVDGFIADREGAFAWSAPSEELFRFHLAQVGELGGFLCGRRLYETMLVWETDPSLRAEDRKSTRLNSSHANIS